MTDAQFVAWLKDSSAIRCVLIEVDVKTGGAETTRFLSNKGYVTSPTDTPANTRYSPFVVGGIKFTETLSLDGTASLSFGDIEIDNLSGDRDDWLDDVWANRAIKVYIGDVRWIRSDFRLVFDGLVANIDTKNRGRLNLKVSDKLQRLNAPITDNKLGGSTENADRLLPLCFGECHNVEPLLVNPVINEYQVHDGPIEGIIEVRDNGVPVAFTPFLSTGKFRLASQPSGQITASVQGDKPSTYANDVASIVQRLATSFGNSPFTLAELDTAAFTAFAAANPQPIGLYVADRMNVIEALNKVAASVGGRVLIDRSGKLSLVKLSIPTNVLRNPTMQGAAAGVTPTNWSVTSLASGISASVSGVAVEDGMACMDVTFSGTATANAVIYINTDALNFHKVVAGQRWYGSVFTRLVAGTGLPNTVDMYVSGRQANNSDNENAMVAGVSLGPTLVKSEVAKVISLANTATVGQFLAVRFNTGRVANCTIRIAAPYLIQQGTAVTPTDIVQQSLFVSQMPAVKAGCQIGYCKNWMAQDNIAAGVPVNHADLYKQEWMTITRTDTLTQADYKTFTEPVMEETLLLTNADALAEADRRLAMWRVQRKAYKYTGMAWLMLETLGAPQTIKNSRFGLTEGKTGQIISLATDWLNPHITVEVLI